MKVVLARYTTCGTRDPPPYDLDLNSKPLAGVVAWARHERDDGMGTYSDEQLHVGGERWGGRVRETKEEELRKSKGDQ